MQGGGSGKLPQKPKAPVLQDPLADLKAFLATQGMGGAVGSQADYVAQANAAYAPSFDYLDNAAGNARGNAAQADERLRQLYGALSNDIQGQTRGIKRGYNQGITETDRAYDDALASMAGSFDRTNAESAAVLRRLGIEQAGTNVLNKSNDTEKLLGAIMQANSLGSQNALREQRHAATTYNNQMGSAAKFAGTEARGGIQKQLMDFLSQIEGKRAELGTEVNKYGLSLQSEAQKAAAANGPNFDDMFKIKELEYRMAKDASDRDLAMAKLTGEADDLDPLGQVRQLAMNLYQGNSQAADNATDVVTRVASDMGSQLGGEPITLEGLISRIRQTLLAKNGVVGDMPQLQRLAAEYMAQRG